MRPPLTQSQRLQNPTVIPVSERDYVAFKKAIENPEQPTEGLLKAFRKFRESCPKSAEKVIG